MGCVVHKCTLYMFGGVYNLADRYDRLGCREAFALDLLQLYQETDAKLKGVSVLPTKLPDMNSKKMSTYAVVVGEKICVFDHVLGHKPDDCYFEVFDPQHKTWDKIKDPFRFKPGFFVDAHYVKGDKLFISVRDNPGIYELHFGASGTPVWSHHNVFHGVSFLPRKAYGVQFGTLILSPQDAFDLADERGFAHHLPVQLSGDTTDMVSVSTRNSLGSATFLAGHNEVCIVQGRLLCEPHLKRRRKSSVRYPLSLKKPWTLKPALRRCSRHSKDGYRFIFNVCSVDSASRPIRMKVLRSFTVPMDYDSRGRESGIIRLASLCHP